MPIFMILIVAVAFGVVFCLATAGMFLQALLIGVLLVISLAVMIHFSNAPDDVLLAGLTENSKAKSHFDYEITLLKDAYKSVELKREFFKAYEEGDSIRKAYDLIDSKIKSNIRSASEYMKYYDYVTLPNTRYLDDLVSECKFLIKKLSKLYDLVLEMKDSTTDVDASFVDDMLKSLVEVSDLGDDYLTDGGSGVSDYRSRDHTDGSDLDGSGTARRF